MKYTLEQIQKFTSDERNEFIDEVLMFLSKSINPRIGICSFIHTYTDYGIVLNPMTDYFLALEIPILNTTNDYWFDTQEERITFLKSIKTC